MTPFFQLDPKIESASAAALRQVAPRFTEIDEVTEYNQLKVLRAFMDNGISERHFGSSTGYGYGDEGRETLDKVWAQVFGAEDALVRHNFTCGTHTLAVALFGVLRPGDKMLCVSGMPYDTLHSVIGLTGENMGSLKDYGIAFDCVPLQEEHLDYEAIAKAVDDTVTMVYIQRSRGYELRASLSLEETQKVAEIAKEKNPNCIVMVDNCYCEFVNKQEPTQVGADLIAGSLIKNAGGMITGPFDSAVRSLLVGIIELGVEEVMVIGHTDCGVAHINADMMIRHLIQRGISQDHIDMMRYCGIDFEAWLRGFDCVENSVAETVDLLRNHPLMPADVTIRGYVINTETGELTPQE